MPMLPNFAFQCQSRGAFCATCASEVKLRVVHALATMADLLGHVEGPQVPFSVFFIMQVPQTCFLYVSYNN